MATNDGATTELFTGWSSVVHQPEDEPEESELPSTVDIGALNAEPPVLSQTQNEAESESESEDSEADSSNSDASEESCSHSDSSDSDSSSSSQESSSRSPSPEFSVTSTQTNGLRLTIATVRKSTNSPINPVKKGPVENSTSKIVLGKVKGTKKGTSSSSSEYSTASGSESESKLMQKSFQNTKKPIPAAKHRVTSNSASVGSKGVKETDREKLTTPSRYKGTGGAGAKESLTVPRLRLSGNSSSNSASNKDKESVVKERDKESPVVSKLRVSGSSREATREREKETTVLPKLRVSNSSSSLNNSNSKNSMKESEKTGAVLTKLRSNTNSSGVNHREKDGHSKEAGPREKEASLVGKLRSSSTAIASNKDRQTSITEKDRGKDSPLTVKMRGSNNVYSTSGKEREGKTTREATSKDSLVVPKLRFSNNSTVSTSTSNSTSNKERDREGSSSRDKDRETGPGKDKERDGKVVGGSEKSSKMADGKSGKKKVRTKRRTKKMASLPLSRSSTYSSSDSESSDDLLPASCSLQEIRQEDLAAILPDQNDCNDFNDFDKNDKDSPTTGDMSGSDMELPQQAINSLIQRTTESSSDGEGHQLPNPQTLFANSLLQQFVANNPLLSPPQTISTPSVNDSLSPSKSLTSTSTISSGNCQNPTMTVKSKDSNDSCQTSKSDVSATSKSVKKRRGRPKKTSRVGGRREKLVEERVKELEVAAGKHVQDFCGGPNVSPDSGIQNSPDHVSSPEPSLSPNIRPKLHQNKEETKKKLSSGVPEPKTQAKTTRNERLSQPSSRNTSQERHLDRTASRNRNVSQERQSRRPITQERKSTRNSSLDSRNSSQEKRACRLASQDKHQKRNSSPEKLHSSRNSSQEKQSSRNVSQEKQSTRHLSQEKQSSRNVAQEKQSSRNLPQEKQSSRNVAQEKQSSRHLSQEKPSIKNVSQEKPSVRHLPQEKQSVKNVSQEKQSSRNSSQEKAPSSEKHSSRNSSQEKGKEPVPKVPVTSTQFDRVLYANADRVLYPPRRKAGRPPVGRRPGRPPKHRTESVEAKSINDKCAQHFKGKGRNKAVLLTTKQPNIKPKSVTLKVPNILHSRHKHKHRKRKFKILKPSVSSDPKINQEIEKLIVDFVKFCVIATKQPKENVPEQILKTLKKVTKKRRTTDHVEKKKKKQSVSTPLNKVNNSNEQRLPLKKRHYHLVSNSSETQKTPDADESKEKVPDKVEEVKSEVKSKLEKKEKVKEKEGKVAPKYVPVIKSHTNNNEYEVKAEKHEKESTAHIEEAIEACINKFADKKTPKNEDKSAEQKLVPATTPKKRHRMENLLPNVETVQISKELVQEIKTESASYKEKLDKFKTNVTVESYINELKIKRNLMSQKGTEAEESTKIVEEQACDVEVKKEVLSTLQVEKTIQVSPESTKKKVRKRRAINRTGFPSVKKKKKKVLAVESVAVPLEESKEAINVPVCDRVPKEGEEYTKFLQRSAGNSMQDLTTIVSSHKPPAEEVMSECESLPQDERTDFDIDDCSSRSESIADNVSESRRSKRSDGDDNESMSLLESSIERLKSRLDQKKRKRSKELKTIPVETNAYPKRRRREESPASSIEPSVETRLRDSASASGDEFSKKSKKTPKWRKKYLPAGLFSDYYKEDESKRQEKSTRNLTYNREDHPYGLLPSPFHCGKYLRCLKVDFQLPYDLWWQHTHSQLPGRDVVPSWNYRKIRSNVYNVKTNGGTCEPQSCNCKASSNCGDDCINRLVLAECPATHRCNNQKIQKHDWAPGIEKFMTENKGWGVRTKESIKQGEFILEYVGEVVSDQEFKERMHSIYVNDTHHYCLHLDGGMLIDGHRMGSDGRFVNHSCQPNCEIQKWSVNGQFRMALFALRDIRSYEELTYDYNFSLFNPAEGQECKCGSEKCRGVIGGKTQRIRQLPESTVPKNPGRVGRPRKTEAKKKPSKETSGTASNPPPPPPPQVVPQIQVKPMSHQQKCFILEHHCFLLRNLTKVRKVRDRSQSITSTTVSRQLTATPTDTSAFMNQLNALQKPRNMKTRRIAQAEDDPELSKTVRLAAVLKDILVAITSTKDENNQLVSTSLMQLPTKRKAPEFYQQVASPIDLSTIEQNIATGVYKTPEAFDEDMTKLFSGFSKFYGRASDAGVATAKLKKIYAHIKLQSLAKFEDVLGLKPPPTFVNRKKNPEEDIIRCICGVPRDEGLMIQCERCMVWQHTECVKADGSAASYHCEVCVPRQVDYEISMDEFTEHGHRYFMTLMRGDLQLRQGDTVYVLRDLPIAGTKKKHTYQTIGNIDYSELDIFRIEALWKDKDTGTRFAYGHHYLRPHETFHEPTRKFFPNEVMRVPLYEAVPVDLIMEHCWVMDLNTYCKGRPMGAQEKHVYICEYRVDKGAKMFSKASRSKFPVCTKSFAFECFEARLKVSRTYCPHDVDVSLLKNGGAGRKRVEKDKDRDKPTPSRECGSNSAAQAQSLPTAPPVQRTTAQQKTRLNKILLNLLGKMPTKQAVDVSYLLEGGRRRKKQETKQ